MPTPLPVGSVRKPAGWLPISKSSAATRRAVAVPGCTAMQAKPIDARTDARFNSRIGYIFFAPETTAGGNYLDLNTPMQVRGVTPEGQVRIAICGGKHAWGGSTAAGHSGNACSVP